MTVLSIEQITDPREIRRYLAGIGVWYRRWTQDGAPPARAVDSLLDWYQFEVQREKSAGGYRFADIVEIPPGPLSKSAQQFERYHWHDDVEVRMIVCGGGSFYFHRDGKPELVLSVGPGDYVSIGSPVQHKFVVDRAEGMTAIRLFRSDAGWQPNFVEEEREN